MMEYLYSVATDQRNDLVAQLVKCVLQVFEIFYRGITTLRNKLYDAQLLKAYHAKRPVICVGNITVGGTGKTPLVIHLSRYIQSLGVKPVILTRGYMPKGSKSPSDECLLLENKLQGVDILQGANRIDSIKMYLKENDCGVFIMDDGFQHRKLHRDLNIVAIDATSPFGNKHLLPRGLLRESIHSLKRADALVLTRCNESMKKREDMLQPINSLGFDFDIMETKHQPTQFVNLMEETITYPFQKLRDCKVVAFCGIGRPQSFQSALSRLDVRVDEFIPYKDHHTYSMDDIKYITSLAVKNKSDFIVMTQKDAVKIQSLDYPFSKDSKWIYMDMNLEVTNGKEKLYARIDHLLLR